MKNSNKNIQSKFDLSGLTNGFTLPLGTTPEEKIDCLQGLKDSMANCMMAAINDDLSFDDSTKGWLQNLYMQADTQIKKLQKSTTLAIQAAIA